jgi:hypothetical protein
MVMSAAALSSRGGDKAAAFDWFRLHALPAGGITDISYFKLHAGLIVIDADSARCSIPAGTAL